MGGIIPPIIAKSELPCPAIKQTFAAFRFFPVQNSCRVLTAFAYPCGSCSIGSILKSARRAISAVAGFCVSATKS